MSLVANNNTSLQSEDLVAMIPALRAFARGFYSQRSDAEDLVQDTLLKALANREKYTPISPLKSWLFTIMRRIFCTRIRLEQREAPGSAECVSSQAIIRAPQEWTVQAYDVKTALYNLPKKYFEVIILIVFEGRSYERTAELCGCSIGTVKSRLHRARYQLQLALEGIHKELGKIGRKKPSIGGFRAVPPH